MLLLASSSSHRRALLGRLGLPFQAIAPDVDETLLDGEEPHAFVTRLAETKARAGLALHPASVAIGADQVAVREGLLLGKPGDLPTARQQLTAASGRAVEFLTAVCVIDGRQVDGEPYLHMDITRVQFRPLAPDEIDRYLEREQPLDAAGSFYSEGLGISLFERIDGLDPTGLVGLPLIWLSGVLRDLGLAVP